MDLEELVGEAREAMRADGVYGKPYEKNGLTVIPAAVVRGGAGGGGGSSPEGQGRGGGFGIKASPSGAWVIEGDTVEWKPAFDLNRAIRGGELVALATILTVRSFVRPKPRTRTNLRRAVRRSKGVGLTRALRRLPAVPRLRHRRGFVARTLHLP
jgi:uncharacterized spore protein YtfJ